MRDCLDTSMNRRGNPANRTGYKMGCRFLLLGISVFAARPVLACEPVVPFMQVMAPAIALSGSLVVLAIAVALQRRVANVSRQHADECCWAGGRGDDRKLAGFLALRSAGCLLFVLAAIAKTRRRGSVSLVGPNFARGARRDHDLRFAG